jgi:hypothetical protein
MKYGLKFISFLVIICICYSCSPTHRFHRLVTKFPYLLDSSRQDKIIVRDSVVKDTQIVWKNKVDTIVFSQVTIERRNDTFRIIERERPCTTYLQKTIYQPSKIVEKYIKEKGQKRTFFQELKYSLFLIAIVLLVLIILFKK